MRKSKCLLFLLATILTATLHAAAQAHELREEWILPGEIAEENGATLAINRASIMLLDGAYIVQIQMVDGIGAVGTYRANTRVRVNCGDKLAVPIDYGYVHRIERIFNYEEMRKHWPLAGIIHPREISATAQNHIVLAVCPAHQQKPFYVYPGPVYQDLPNYGSIQEVMSKSFQQSHWSNPETAFKRAQMIVSANKPVMERIATAINAEGSQCTGASNAFQHHLRERDEYLDRMQMEVTSSAVMRPYETRHHAIEFHDEVLTRLRRAVMIADACGIEIDGLPAQGFMIPAELLPTSKAGIVSVAIGRYVEFERGFGPGFGDGEHAGLPQTLKGGMGNAVAVGVDANSDSSVSPTADIGVDAQ